MMCDNSSTIKLSKNPVMHGRSKHIDVRFHFLRDLTKEEVVKLVHCGTNDQVADILTKPLKFEVFLKLCKKLRRQWQWHHLIRGSIPATAPFDSCPLGVSADSCPAGAP
ncbi:Retrovirus-related Pol polyprotein from transposon TNT 1-94 [Vitis vinifera]|uniref:Retrovirus-related Pol polyprotein from transposon TNT 1-94 n=1 Tax=Vitis vinifera TaxID=29760 RepID=A0A438CAJ1_VITVI|nr:Retrovirus-related Pol polyprotein from transposon TNT 1-94 [Vitis vinifera]